MPWVSNIKPRAIWLGYNRKKNKVIFKCPKCFRTFDGNDSDKCPHCGVKLDFSMYYGG